MIIKSFTAESASAALKLVRREMGGNAIVLKTVQREDAGSESRVEITACLDRPTVSQSSTLLAGARAGRGTADDHNDREPLGGRLAAMEDKLDRLVARADAHAGTTLVDHAAQIESLRLRLTESDYPPGFITSALDEIEQTLQTVGEYEHVAHRILLRRLSELMTPGLDVRPGDRVVFVGPAGMGKSSVMAKLAAQLTAVDRHCVRLARLNSATLTDHDGADGSTVTLIDSPALPADAERIQAMAAHLAEVQPTHCVAVFSSLARASSIARLATAVAPLRPTHLTMTMFDMDAGFGPAVAAAMATDLKIALITNSPGNTGQVVVPDPETATSNLLCSGGGDV